MQLTYRNDTRWVTAATYYTISVPEADLSIVVIDSPRGIPSYMSAPYGDCNELCMVQLAALGCTNSSELPAAPQCMLAHVAWLNRTLAALTTKWKFVALHHPIDEGNLHFVVPALSAHGVQAIFAGHIHNMQHNIGADGVHYFISGAGAFASAALAEDVAAIRGRRGRARGPHLARAAAADVPRRLAVPPDARVLLRGRAGLPERERRRRRGAGLLPASERDDPDDNYGQQHVLAARESAERLCNDEESEKMGANAAQAAVADGAVPASLRLTAQARGAGAAAPPPPQPRPLPQASGGP